MKGKRFIALLLAGMMVLTMAACGSSNNAGTDSQLTESTGGSASESTSESTASNLDAEAVVEEYVSDGYIAEKVRIIGSEVTTTLYPWGTNVGNNALFEIYEKLFDYTNYGGEVKAVLADATKGEFAGYDHEEGTNDYTVYLHENIYDHVGNHITASDVKFSYDTQVAETNPTGSSWLSFESVEVVDEYTVVFHFTREMSGLDDLSNFWTNCFVISEKAWNDSTTGMVSDSCGTGPYIMENYVSGSNIVLTRSDDYWQTNEDLMIPSQGRNVEKIEYVISSESSQQIIALQTGDVDVVVNVSINDLATFENDDNYGIFSYTQMGQVYLACNNSSGSICEDLNMRLALYYAIDVAGICAVMGNSSVAQAHSLFGAQHSDYDPAWESWDNYQNVTDLELSKQYAEAAGYNGEELYMMAKSEESAVAEIIQNQLTAAGFKVNLNILDSTTFDNTEMQEDGWDIELDKNAGVYGAISNTRSFLTKTSTNMTRNFIADQEWFAMLELINTIEGHTSENIDAWMQRAYDNGYAFGLYSKYNNIVYRSSIGSLVRNGKNVFLPGGFTYVDPDA